MMTTLSRNQRFGWLISFILLSTTWLLAPSLNSALSDRTSLISQYETSGQPYALFFRLGDILASLLLAYLIIGCFRHKLKSPPLLLLLIISIGMLVDPLFVTNCHVSGSICQERFSISSLIHGIETMITASALIVLSVYDAKVRQKLVSISFVAFQICYGILFMSQFANHQRFNTASQYIYQYIVIIWLAWFVQDFLFGNSDSSQPKSKAKIVRYSVAIWVLLNGFLAIILSLRDIHLLGKAQALYFTRDTAWLAQHGVIVGVVMLYLSRHLLRGERRAQQILLTIIGVEVLKYAVITPSWPLVVLYSVSFCLLFVTADNFKRGYVPLTWQVRVKDLVYMVCTLAVVSCLALLVLGHNNRIANITGRSFKHFFYYSLHADKIRRTHKESVLLANTEAVFLIVGTVSVLWILFRPNNLHSTEQENPMDVLAVLRRYSDSTEDYFKLWPADKRYFWYQNKTGFIAYKIVGSVAFALADPVAQADIKHELVKQFTEWARARRLKTCFLPVTHSNLELYKDLKTLQIGASSLVDTTVFVETTVKDKWWRWKINRAIRQEYNYAVSNPPHSASLLDKLAVVSDDWLTNGKRQERGFALGYFDKAYLDQCDIHYLKNKTGEIVAFANQVPNFKAQDTVTIDLMRYVTDDSDSMSYLLSEAIKTMHSHGFDYFDLGFVPFAATTGSLQTVAQSLSSNRFSAKGLEQFKNKFKPDWQNVYLAYDGDLADLTIIALHIETAMSR